MGETPYQASLYGSMPAKGHQPSMDAQFTIASFRCLVWRSPLNL